MAGGGRTETAAQRRKPRAKFFGGDVATLTLPGSVTVGENQALELTYRYVVGYGCDGTPDGPTFQVHVENLLPSFGHNVGAEQGPFTDFPYDDTYDGSDCAGCPTCYSPVQTQTIDGPLIGTVSIVVNNNGRNMHFYEVNVRVTTL